MKHQRTRHRTRTGDNRDEQTENDERRHHRVRDEKQDRDEFVRFRAWVVTPPRRKIAVRRVYLNQTRGGNVPGAAMA